MCSGIAEVGSWQSKLKNGRNDKFRYLSILRTATGWFQYSSGCSLCVANKSKLKSVFTPAVTPKDRFKRDRDKWSFNRFFLSILLPRFVFPLAFKVYYKRKARGGSIWTRTEYVFATNSIWGQTFSSADLSIWLVQGSDRPGLSLVREEQKKCSEINHATFIIWETTRCACCHSRRLRYGICFRWTKHHEIREHRHPCWVSGDIGLCWQTWCSIILERWYPIRLMFII